MEELYEVFYQAKYKELRLILKPPRKKEVEGEVIEIGGEHIQFRNFRYIPGNRYINDGEEKISVKKDVEIIDKLLKKCADTVWKVSIEEQKLANEFRAKRDKVDKEYAEQLELMQKMDRPQDGITIVRGTKGTETTSGSNNSEPESLNLLEQ
jgi:hypothetical protein